MTKGTLYIVATPIGNLQDISFRAIETLKSCNIIACENTTNSKKLLDYYDIKAKLIPYNDHSNERQRNGITALLAKGENVALITDKGTPLISDPGYKLTREVVKSGFNIYAIPGACSFINALVSSCLPTNKVFFAGFVDGKESSLKELYKTKATLVIFESPKRIVKTLKVIESVFGGNTNICVSKEMTKMFETHLRGNLQSVIKELESYSSIKGEFVITIDNNKEEQEDLTNFDEKIKTLLQFNVPVKEIANVLSSDNALKKELYKYILNIKNTIN